MMSTGDIRMMQRRAAVKAARERQEPYVFFTVDDVQAELRTVPFLGTHVSRNQGWRAANKRDMGPDYEYLFVDMSGFGHVGEPALTYDQAVAVVQNYEKRARACGQRLGWGLYEVGQFQGYIRAYIRTGKG